VKFSTRTPVSPRYLKVPQRNFKFPSNHSIAPQACAGNQNTG
jgi:hypothetical protein